MVIVHYKEQYNCTVTTGVPVFLFATCPFLIVKATGILLKTEEFNVSLISKT
jgi:hypothetical protein